MPLGLAGETAHFEKPNGARVTLHLEADVLIADEPGKPRMRFRRA